MIDPQIALGVQPAQIQSPMDAYAKALSLKNMMQQGQLGQQQLQAATLENQQRQIALAQTQALNKAYADAITPGGADGSAPDIDTGKLTSALAASNAGAAIPGVLKGVNEFHQSAALLAKTRGEVAAQQTDAAGSLGLALQKADYDPRLFLTLAQHAVNMKAVDPSTITPATSQVALMLQQDPSGAQAKAAVQQLADNWVRLSPGAQKQLNEAKTAQGAADRGTAAVGELGIKQTLLPGQVQGQALTNKKLAQETTGTQPLSPYQSQDLKIKGAEAGAAVSNANTNTARFNQQYGDPVANATPQEIAAAKMRAAGTLPLPSPRSPGYDKAVALAQHFDTSGTFDQYAGTRFNTIRDFKNSGDANNLVAITTALGHLERAQQNSAALGTEPSMALNWTPTQRRYHQDVYNLTDEIGRLIKAGVLPEAEGKRAIGNLMSFSQSNRDAGLDELSKLMGGKFEGIVQKYRNGTGMALPASMFDAPTLDRLKRQGLANGLDMGGAAPQPQPGAPAPAAATAPAAGQPAAAGSVSVTDPNGGVHVFPNQAAANKFKQLAGIK